MNTVVAGGSGGLGAEVILRIAFPSTNWSLGTGVDVADRLSIHDAVEKLQEPLEYLINCVGVNALFRFDEISEEEFEHVMRINAWAFPLMVQELRAAGKLQSKAKLCNVISNAAHMPMTHSLIYNASKAAQEIITRQMARELKEYIIFGVSPNKLRGTGMSRYIESLVPELRGWTPEQARAYQLAALPSGEETEPAAVAAFIVDLLQPIHKDITGCIFPYGN